MWSVINRIGQFVGLVQSEPPVDLNAIYAVLDAEEEINEEQQTAESIIENTEGVTCQHRVGIVTALFDSHGYITTTGVNQSDDSDQLYFNRKDGPVDLKVGNQVEYLTYRMSEEENWIVRKILFVNSEFWDSQQNTEADNLNAKSTDVKEQCETAYKNVMAKVTGREGRTVLAGNLQFSLDSVEVDFIPVEGDWLVLESLVQTEETADTLLVVDRVSPVRTKQLVGRVSHWSSDSDQGIVDREIVFDKDACECGYLPRVGDEVVVYCIESEQGALVWRAVRVVPTNTSPLEQYHDSQAMTALLENKHGVVISEDTNCGVLYLGQETNIKVEVKNANDNIHILKAVEIFSHESQFSLIEPSEIDEKIIQSQECLHFVFRVKGRFIGQTTELVVFKFKGFEIGRQLVVDVQTASLAASLSDSRNRGGAQRTKHEPIPVKKLLASKNGFTVPGVRPIKPAAFVPVNLGGYAIPEKLINIVYGADNPSRKEGVIARLLEYYKFLSDPIDMEHYVLRWDTLIHLEELEHKVNIARYDTQASFQRVQDYLSLEIPGLAERRPSLIVGDKVTVQEAWSNENSCPTYYQTVKYEGFIHKVLSNEILIKFDPNFHDTCSGIYSISFEASRTTFRREHQAIHVAFNHLSADWLFPSHVIYQPPQIMIAEEENCLNQELITVSTNKKEEPNNEITHKIAKLQDFLQNEKTTEGDLNCISSSTLSSSCDKIIDNNNLINTNNAIAKKESKTELFNYIKNCDKHLSNEDVTLVKTQVDEILDNATDVVNNKVNSKDNKHKECGEKRVKCKVSDRFEKLAPKDETPPKVSPPRVPVVARFLQNGNCPPSEKNQNQVKSMLQQLASLSPNECIPAQKQSMKTLEEIEQTLLNSSSNSILNGIEKLPEKNDKDVSEKEVSKSHFEQLFNVKNKLDNTTLKKELIANGTSQNTQNKNKQVPEKNKEYVNNHNKALKYNKVNWNSNTEMKIGNEKEAKCRIPVKKRKKLIWYNTLLNHYQKEAVRNILKGEARPLPYVIFGPPGTGKTITLIEAALQIYFLIPESRLLIATPSNSSADLLCERLVDSGLLLPGDLLRLAGHHYTEQGRISEKLQPYCGTADIRSNKENQQSSESQEGVVNLSRHAIGRHRITVGTCNTLGVLYQMGFPRGHFTHVLVDEAGQATEPQILIPLAFLHKSYGQTVLAGDPLQLGPVVLSKIAEHFGLGESLLARLLQRTPYLRDPVGYPTTGGYNPHLVTRLVYNYRSLPEILSLPNKMFYDDDLVPQVAEEASEEARVLAALKDVLPMRADSKPHGLVFHGIRGTNCQAPDSPSWYNPHEVVQVATYLQALYTSGLEPEDCGIITPYQAQVLKIRHMLEVLEMPLPKIGSVEEFQGQERMAIILSTVRSSPRLIEGDLRHTIGFVASPRRLNVAITRARAVLIILGNPHLLAQDQYWRTVLDYCVQNHAYTGCNPPTLNN